VLTSSTPGVSKSLSASMVGTLHSPAGLQVSYGGSPLYLFGYEGVAPTKTGGFGATGSGNGIKVDGGTFELVTP
jgi:hypothetical protein